MDALTESIKSTIANRKGKIKLSIFEINSFLEDTRMQVIGGIQGTFDIWNLAVIPALLNNCETWTDISDDSITELENLQNLFIRVILQVPVSCPKAATCYETGFTLIKFKIMEKKLNFAKYLQLLHPESLANQVYTEQQKLQFPGLFKECINFSLELNLKEEFENDEIKIKQFKKIVKIKIMEANERELKTNMIKSSKSDEIMNDTFGLKQYFKELNVEEARTKFKLRTHMIKTKFNYKNDRKNSYDNWACDSCESAIDSQSHVLWCPAYEKLRAGKNLQSDKDLVQYYAKVLLLRQKLKLKR